VADGEAPVQVRERTRAGTFVVVLVAALVVALIWLSLCDKRWTSSAQSPAGADATVLSIG
jgi:multidrug resistance efflux pump